MHDRFKYAQYLEKIYDYAWLTNNGEMTQELQKRLEDYLGVKNILLVSSGTMALIIAYRLLILKNEVNTTPFIICS